MTALRSPEDVLTVELKEIHTAERLLARVLPKLAKKVSSEHLRELLDQRLEQGERLIEDIEETLEEMEAPKARQRNLGAEGLIEDVNGHLEEIEDERLLDPLLLASVQKIEHYCIAAWGTAASMGRLLNQEKLVKAMEQVLDEGKKLDQQMTKLAEEEINPQMLEGKDEEGHEEGDENEEERTREGSGRLSKRTKLKQRTKSR